MQLKSGEFGTRIYGVLDNPKGTYTQDSSFLGTTLKMFLQQNNLTSEDIWRDDEQYLWLANLYPVCDSREETIRWALLLKKMADGKADNSEIEEWKSQKRLSLWQMYRRLFHGSWI